MSMESSSRSSRRRPSTNRSWQPSTTRCRCGDIAGSWTSWTSRNPGRKFLSCPNYQDPSRNCNYFQWLDPEIEEDCYRKTLYDLHVEVMRCERDKVVDLQLMKKAKKDVVLMKICVVVLILINIFLVCVILRM